MLKCRSQMFGRTVQRHFDLRLRHSGLAFALWVGVGVCAQLNVPAAENESAGKFLRLYWYERGLEHGNPYFDGRFRVNSPEAVIHPSYGQRREVRESGMMRILIEEDLRRLSGVELYLELWGGHPGTSQKRLIVNGRGHYAIPEVGTADKHCTHQYPTIPLAVTDLVNGYNAIQFACDQGSGFWGHFIVDNACLRLALTNGHPHLVKEGLAPFKAELKTTLSPGDRELIVLELESSDPTRIAAVDFEGFYSGYDENGNTLTHDWHGFTKDRKPSAILGTATEPPFRLNWDVRMLPAQKEVTVRATIHFKGLTNLVYLSRATSGCEIPDRTRTTVALYSTADLPQPFWSRANRARECSIHLDIAPERIEAAELHVVAWTGGPGDVRDYFKLNGRHLGVADGAAHRVAYSHREIDPKLLQKGANKLVLLSDTEHHGIEIFRPGPALMVRYRNSP
ncbi:MAG: hypothetical protein HY735_13810 [Verrucomicrobia bacterium]|nr:hypothetical protein [Verrucomicrobiota bacterium]